MVSGTGGWLLFIVERTQFDFSRPRKVQPPGETFRTFLAEKWSRSPVAFLGARKMRTFYGGSTLGSKPRKKLELRRFLP